MTSIVSTNSLSFFTANAFTKERFGGNPAGICLLNQELSEEQYQAIACEVNLSETAFVQPVKKGGSFTEDNGFTLRWFSPTVEVPLCGHATLATSHVLFNLLGNVNETIQFETLSGKLVTRKGNDGAIVMDFPKSTTVPIKLKGVGQPNFDQFSIVPDFVEEYVKQVVPNMAMIEGFRYAAGPKKLVVVLKDTCHRSYLENLKPNFSEMERLDPSGGYLRAIVVTLRGSAANGCVGYDFVSRNFPIWYGIKEDPATGSAHCILGPYWASVLGKKDLRAFQCSKRGGEFQILANPADSRVYLTGTAVTGLKGSFYM